MILKKFCLAAGAVLATLNCFGNAFPERTVRVPELTEVNLQLDGIPNEPFWKKAGVIDEMLVFRRNTPAEKQTRAMICFDKNNLYIGLIFEEPNGVRFARNTTSPFAGDGVELFLGANAPEEWLRQIVFNTTQNTYQEGIERSEYRLAVRTEEKVWSAELVIPRRNLGAITDGRLRFNLFRHRSSANPGYTTWSKIFWAHDLHTFNELQIYVPADEIAHGPWTFGISATAAGINFETAGACTQFIRFREKNGGDFQTVNTNLVEGIQSYSRMHPVLLHNLKPDTEYEYQLPDGRIHTFRTLTGESSDFSFAFVSDIHGHSVMLSEILRRPAVQAADLLFAGGDLLSAVNGRGSLYTGFLNSVMDHWKKPFYCLRGNHEYRGMAPNALQELFPGAASYRAFSHKGMFFILLDTGTGDGFEQDPEFMDRQIAWLQKIVAGKEFAEAEFRVIVAHIPMYKIVHGGGREIMQIYNALSPETKNAIDLQISGHTHSYRKSMPGQTTLFYEYPLSQTARNTPVLPCPFPVITNPLEGTISVSKNAKELSVRVFSERGGKLLDEFKVVKRKFRK